MNKNIIIGVVVLVILALGGYFFLGQDSNSGGSSGVLTTKSQCERDIEYYTACIEKNAPKEVLSAGLQTMLDGARQNAKYGEEGCQSLLLALQAGIEKYNCQK